MQNLYSKHFIFHFVGLVSGLPSMTHKVAVCRPNNNHGMARHSCLNCRNYYGCATHDILHMNIL